jgi:hypothetical protein
MLELSLILELQHYRELPNKEEQGNSAYMK